MYSYSILCSTTRILRALLFQARQLLSSPQCADPTRIDSRVTIIDNWIRVLEFTCKRSCACVRRGAVASAVGERGDTGRLELHPGRQAAPSRAQPHHRTRGACLPAFSCPCSLHFTLVGALCSLAYLCSHIHILYGSLLLFAHNQNPRLEVRVFALVLLFYNHNFYSSLLVVIGVNEGITPKSITIENVYFHAYVLRITRIHDTIAYE